MPVKTSDSTKIHCLKAEIAALTANYEEQLQTAKRTESHLGWRIEILEARISEKNREIKQTHDKLTEFIDKTAAAVEVESRRRVELVTGVARAFGEFAASVAVEEHDERFGRIALRVQSEVCPR
ncbi:hypothetical protein VE00_03834 [Pseudogymnoascus sp. WSF 3629]|nr:hypothetical protein VE00_03834 [Pseudogymnoascus sp. WSF 3629]